jgi:DNA-binding transcriptional MerR regulator
MRMADLSRNSGVPIATIKFYQREGLVPAGTRTAANQAQYDETHVRRLRLIGSLTGVSRLGLGAVRQILAAMDDPGVPLAQLHAVVSAELLAGRPLPLSGEPLAQAAGAVERSLAARGWRADRDAPAYGTLVEAVAALQQLAGDADEALLEPFLKAVEALAQRQAAALVKQDAENDRMAVAARTAVFATALDALRMLAEHRFLQEYGEQAG